MNSRHEPSCTKLERPNNRFYCKKCDTYFETEPFNFFEACCPYCGYLIVKTPHCGICHMPIGKKSKGIKCGYCNAVFTDNGYFKMWQEYTGQTQSFPLRKQLVK